MLTRPATMRNNSFTSIDARKERRGRVPRALGRNVGLIGGNDEI